MAFAKSRISNSTLPYRSLQKYSFIIFHKVSHHFNSWNIISFDNFKYNSEKRRNEIEGNFWYSKYIHNMEYYTILLYKDE